MFLFRTVRHSSILLMQFSVGSGLRGPTILNIFVVFSVSPDNLLSTFFLNCLSYYLLVYNLRWGHAVA
jgi:hypothetical protein